MGASVKMVAKCSLAMAAVIAAGCEANASNPTMDATRRNFFQSETQSVYVASTHTLFLGTNDEQGERKVDPNNPGQSVCITPGFIPDGSQLLYRGQTFAGLSTATFDNLGVLTSLEPVSWMNRGDIQPVAPSQCTAAHCPLALAGDPWLATNGTRVLYANLGVTSTADYCDTTNVDPDSVVVARSEDGTPTFAPPYVAAYLPGEFPDQESLSMAGDAAMLGFDTAHSKEVYVVTTEDSGNDAAWGPPQALPLAFASHGGYSHVIVKMVSSNLAYLAYLDNGRVSLSRLPRRIRGLT